MNMLYSTKVSPWYNRSIQLNLSISKSIEGVGKGEFCCMPERLTSLLSLVPRTKMRQPLGFANLFLRAATQPFYKNNFHSLLACSLTESETYWWKTLVMLWRKDASKWSRSLHVQNKEYLWEPELHHLDSSVLMRHW